MRAAPGAQAVVGGLDVLPAGLELSAAAPVAQGKVQGLVPLA